MVDDKIDYQLHIAFLQPSDQYVDVFVGAVAWVCQLVICDVEAMSARGDL